MVVLLAEDDELILKTVEHKLKKEGFEVILTRNGQEAIELIKTKEIHLIISDIMMPFASGIEILAVVKQLERPIPIIMLSSMGQEEIVVEAFELGASDYMIKPFSPNELVLRINKLVNRH
ncbi:response regulator [Sphingobacterium sp. DK4209]|uniref:Response regulator n=1 Tax=Sphingobacterium zhuxiongii TaxID=2662364 RepID=A0A5Q0QDI1_9SPHI|nr:MULTISPECIES: response regulator [unclassified Sphingobacterium]MVZ64642.1 response regulator [Sphingobacterium sp. DK4209]QGA26981.1 response regulator [Sphingobacterium sp. dk4302]